MKAMLVSLLVCSFVCGCRDRAGTDDEAVPHSEAAAGSPVAHEAEAADRLLRIDAAMLRDVRITTTAAEARPSGEGVTALGELHVNDDAYAEVGTPITARVLEVRVAVSEPVQAGQALVELQSVELGRARADYLRAGARAQLANQALRRTRTLAAERIAPQREVQEAEAEAQGAAADVAAAAAGLGALGITANDEAVGADSAHFVLRAPIGGSVIDRQAVQGQLVDPAQPLFRIADLTRLWLIVHVFEREAVRLSLGATPRVTFAALPGRTFAGTLSMIGAQVDVRSRTVPVRIEIANDAGLLRPGMSATAWLPLGEAGAPIVAVPTAALQRVGDAWCVFLPHGEGVFDVRPVGRGRDLNGEVEIVTGVTAGETIVVDGAFLLKAEAERVSGDGEHHEH
jgi:membrane fusion protein, heavy metal efflux system